MERERGFKIVAIVALLVAIAGLTIGYAAYTETLTIDGSAKVSPSQWKVQFTTDGENVGALTATKTGKAEVTTEATLAAATVSGFDVTLKAPGDSVTYNFEVSNLGDLDAKLTNYTLGTLSCTPSSGSAATQEDANAICGGLNYTVVYTGGSAPAVNDKLLCEDNATDGEPSSKPVTLKLEWPSTSTVEVPDDIDVTIGTTTFVYTQD